MAVFSGLLPAMEDLPITLRLVILFLLLGINSFFSTMHHIDHPFREIKFFYQLKNPIHYHWYFFRGLENKGVPTGNRIRQKPKWDHSGEVKWGNARTNSNRLPDHEFIYSTGNVF